MNTKYKLILLATILFFASCKKNLLQTEFKNGVTVVDVYSDPENVKGVASGMFYTWYNQLYYAYSYSPIMAMWTMADQGTASWGNGAMLDLSSEPRTDFNNSEDYTHKKITQNFYGYLYGNLVTANDILYVINEGMEIGEIDGNGVGSETAMVKAFSYFNQGITLGYLGLVFDKAYIVKETEEETDINNPKPYNEVADAAIISFEKCIEVCNNNSFTIPDTWINGSEYSNAELARLAHSFIARILIYNARTATENNATDWNKVLVHATDGIQRDLAPYMDNTTWKNNFFNYTFNNATLDWCGVDSRIIHMMDENYPAVYPDLSVEPKPTPAVSDDHRLVTDFRYDATCPLHADRGYYHFFDYEYSRYDYNTYDHPDYVIDFSVTENDLIRAEALFHTGNKNGAIDILNNGPRVTRGFLPALAYSISDDEFLYALFYERDIELYMTGFGKGFFDMRRRDMLQTGTLLHFPIPAKELNVMTMPIYTFGGVANADGINTSNGGWFTGK